jgi:hypothetical protein
MEFERERVWKIKLAGEGGGISRIDGSITVKVTRPSRARSENCSYLDE